MGAEEDWATMLKAYIVDDEPLARDELKYLLLRSKQVEILGESDCIDQTLADVQALRPDIIFLDIDLEGENGLALARQLESLENPPAIIFATAYDEYALQAFERAAIDYILKPFEEDRIVKTLKKIAKMKRIGGFEANSSQSPVGSDLNGKIAVFVDERIILLTYSDIVYLESSEGKCTIKTSTQTYKVNEALVVWEKKLSTAPFIRVHRSYIVNLEHIQEIEPWFNSTYNLIMKDHSKVPVSRTHVKELKQLIGF